MKKAKFLFRKFTNSFLVKVENLEELSVHEIQKIEKFVKDRDGVFDFERYEFVIQKRLEFDKFVDLVDFCGLDAVVFQKITQAKQHPRVSFGRYKGMFYKEVPSSYLLWLKSNYYGTDREFLDEELKSRRI
ncbi:MAG: hypothetical protein GXO30_05790 [Epsilonproteobacteria bacterium]|nr:hypothetical protein [Campylobacterota bacterium]